MCPRRPLPVLRLPNLTAISRARDAFQCKLERMKSILPCREDFAFFFARGQVGPVRDSKQSLRSAQL